MVYLSLNLGLAGALRSKLMAEILRTCARKYGVKQGCIRHISDSELNEGKVAVTFAWCTVVRIKHNRPQPDVLDFMSG